MLITVVYTLANFVQKWKVSYKKQFFVGCSLSDGSQDCSVCVRGNALWSTVAHLF